MYRYVIVMCMLYSDCGSAHCNGCVVNGISARTAFLSIITTEV